LAGSDFNDCFAPFELERYHQFGGLFGPDADGLRECLEPFAKNMERVDSGSKIIKPKPSLRIRSCVSGFIQRRAFQRNCGLGTTAPLGSLTTPEREAA
jgi:hypothetical protein